MRDVCGLIWLALIGLFRSRASLQAEILTLRHQLNVLRRQSPQRLPILIVSGALDILTPPETGAALAALYGATCQLEPAHGHNVLLGEGARRIAEDVIAWVVGRLTRQGSDRAAGV